MQITDISIYSDAFEKLREDFDKLMQQTIYNMKEKGSTAAAVSVKIDIDLEKTFAPVELPDGTRSTRDVYLPKFTHKVSSVMNIKEETKGAYEEECELMWDPARQKFMLVPIGYDQMTLQAEVERWEDDDE